MAQEKRQRQRENREKKLAAERKAARAKALRRRIIQVVVLFVIVVAVLGVNSLLGGDDETTTETTVPATATSTTTTAPEPTTTSTGATTTIPAETESAPVPEGYEDYRLLPVACGGSLPDPVEQMTFDAPEDQGINAGDTVIATMVTSCGDIVLELNPAAAPETVNSFVFLARQGFFDGTPFHRIMEGFMAQGGDPTALGTGNPGYFLPDELAAVDAGYTKGTLAMANSGTPNSSGSQFFIMLADFPLGPSYSVFGKTADSDATLAAIEAVPKGTRRGELSAPLEGVWIDRIDIEVVASS